MQADETLRMLRQLNDSEIFYRNYRLAKSSPDTFPSYLDSLKPEEVRGRALLIPEWPETIRPEYLEESFFSPDRRIGLNVVKHNCYTPPVPHYHDFFEMFYVLEGQCVHEVGGYRSVLRTGDLCLIQPKVTHSLDVSDESVIIDVLIRRTTFRHYFYNILQGDNTLANFFMSTLYSTQGISYLIFHTGGDDELPQSFLRLCGEFHEKQEYYSVLVNAIATSIFVRLLRSYMDACELPENQLRDTQTAIRIARYLQLYAASATLGGLAAELHYTPEYTSRLIKRVTGQTFMQLLTAIRLENAEQLLRDTALPLSEIAAAVGYESSEHFVRTFHAHKGLTPSAYRHKKRNAAFSGAGAAAQLRR